MMDRSELERLRARYGGPQDATTHEPRYRRVVDGLFRDGTRVPPYAGVPTLLAAPHRPEALDLTDLGPGSVHARCGPSSASAPTTRC